MTATLATSGVGYRAVLDDDATETGRIRCAECCREADELLTIKDQWTWWSDGCGELLPFCPECAKREFGHAPIRTPATRADDQG